MSVPEIRGALRRWAERNERSAVALLVGAWRSAPRAPGARFAASEGGETAGSVSAGCVEADLAERLRTIAVGGAGGRVRYGIDDADAAAVGLSCGGEIELLLAPQRADDPVWAGLLNRLDEEREAVLVTALDGPFAGRRLLVDPSGAVRGGLGDVERDRAATDVALAALESGDPPRVARLEGDEGEIFVEPFPRPLRIVVVGAGPIAEALAALCRPLGIPLVVVDPREGRVRSEALSGAEWVAEWPEDGLPGRVDRRTAVVALAHDGKLDLPALDAALRARAGYVGLLGGGRTQARRREELAAGGWDASELERIRGPVGLDIGAETPAEIALSILAEIVAWHRGASRE